MRVFLSYLPLHKRDGQICTGLGLGLCSFGQQIFVTGLPYAKLKKTFFLKI